MFDEIYKTDLYNPYRINFFTKQLLWTILNHRILKVKHFSEELTIHEKKGICIQTKINLRCALLGMTMFFSCKSFIIIDII